MNQENPEIMPLNKYLSHAGVCSRRDAVDFIKDGRVIVNGKSIYEPGFKVTDNDEVTVDGKSISNKKEMVYILLNKPLNTITSTEDPQGRETVMDLVKDATKERIYPIGRLDWNTTGVLILTNDGKLTQKLSHPSYGVQKIYEVTLDRDFTQRDFDVLWNGLDLEDGRIAPDELDYVTNNVVRIQIHSGKNRIVRRIFESLDYEVQQLDRIMFGNISKGNLKRGDWRKLTEKEILELSN